MPAFIYYINIFPLLIGMSFSMVAKAQHRVQIAPIDSFHVMHRPLPGSCSPLPLADLRKNSEYSLREAKMNRDIRNAPDTLNGDTIILPVVIHIINNNPFSITDQQVIDGINLLNDAFSKTGVYSASLGADSKIRFCIAKKDPDGGNTTGITRTKYIFGHHMHMDNEDRRLKNLIQWDPVRYINIWLLEGIEAEFYGAFICGTQYRLRVGGYATMPPGGGPLDGIVITRFGVLLAHEMGHYLGLYHTFEEGCNNYTDCLFDGDQVCDTPPDNSVFGVPCNFTMNTCSSDTFANYSSGVFHTDVPDQTDNFMDYSNEACQNRFTPGQVTRMRNAIMTQRNGLLQDECVPPCSENIIASFTRNIAYPIPGDVIIFTNTSSPTLYYEWLVNDLPVATTNSFTYTSTAIGKVKITLKAYNTINCFAAYSDFIITNCGVVASYYTDKKAIASKLGVLTDSIRFTNHSYNALTYQWFISNNLGLSQVYTSTNITYVFPTPALYTIRLVASNGACSDTTDVYTIFVDDPTPDASTYAYGYCYQQTKLKIVVCVSSRGYLPVPANTPVTFYDADPQLITAHKLSPTFYLPYQVPGKCTYCFDHIVDVQYPYLDRLYLVVSDSGNAIPVVLPNRQLIERDYSNNFGSAYSLRFKASATPDTATLLPGDTLQLNATGAPKPPGNNTYLWSGAYKLSCSNCSSPFLYADSDRIKRVIVTSAYGCYDTAYADIRVPPANDYTIQIDSVICSSHDSMLVNFTVHNSFFRGVIPKDLKISFYKNSTAAGGSLLLPVFSVPDTTFALQKTFTAKVKIMQEGTLYAVVNDSSLIIPISLPNTPMLEKDYTNNVSSKYYQPTKTIINASICQGQNHGGHTTAGTYIDTLSAFNGCDSIRTLTLTVRPVFSTVVTTTICQGQNYAGHTTSGNYTDVYAAINGCDSTRLLHLTVLPTFATTVTTSICQGQNYAGHTTAGAYVDVYSAINGCDSTRTLFLTIKPTFATSVTTSICQGQNYAGHTTSGTYVDVYSASNGCDSTRTLNLTVKPTFATSIAITICQGYNYAGHTTSGTYVDIYAAINGCDSTRTLFLTVNPIKQTTVTTAICQGYSYAGHTTSGTYVDLYSTILGCDSTRTLYLTVKPTVSSNLSATICQDDNYFGHTNPGTYIDVYTGVNGCDSTRTVQLFVNPKKITTLNPSICNGQTYFAGGRMQITTGVYVDTLPTYLGCDSVITTNLTVNPLPVPDLGIDRGVCIGYSLKLDPGNFVSYRWQDGSVFGTYTATATGVYFVQVANTFGCKSSDTMTLTKIFPLPTNFLPLDTSLCKGNPVNIQIPGYISYLWNTGDNRSFINISKSGVYRLIVSDRNSCIGSDSIKVVFNNCAAVWIPNAFSPNNDGLNEIFKPIFPAPVTNYHLQIWNRWGLMVFESTNPNVGWDGMYKGQRQQAGVNVYIVSFTDIELVDQWRKGMVTLVR